MIRFVNKTPTGANGGKPTQRTATRMNELEKAAAVKTAPATKTSGPDKDFRPLTRNFKS